MVLVALTRAPTNVGVGESARHEPDPPDADVRLRQHGEAIDRAKVQPASRPEDASGFRDERIGVKAMLERAERDDAAEGSLGKWEVLAIAADERSRDSRALKPTAGNDEPAKRDVDADRALPTPLPGEHQIRRAASDVEPPAVRHLVGIQVVEPLGGAGLRR